LVITWTALIAIPGAVPWAAPDDTARAIAIGIGIATIVALVGLALAWVNTDQLGDEGATFGTAAALVGLALVALEVVNLMLLPEDAPYRQTAIGIGLLTLIAIGLIVVTAMRTHLFEGLRFTNGTIVGGIVGAAIVIVYLLMVQSMFLQAGPDTEDAEWTRLNTLLTGIQTLAFAALGALLGTAVQSQVTSNVRTELGVTETVADDLAAANQKASAGIRKLQAQQGEGADVLVLEALGEDPTRYISPRAQRRWLDSHRPVAATSAEEIANDLDQALERSMRLRGKRART
jgi:hypothetical protein